MGKPELGTKCTCTGCNERFYDLNRLPATCPKCGAEQPPVKPRAVRPPRATFGNRFQSRQPIVVDTADDEVEAVSTSEAEDEEDAVEIEDETDADIEIDPDLAKATD